MTTAFQSGAFQDDSFQIDTAAGIVGSIATTLGGASVSVTGLETFSGAISTTLAGATAAITGAEIFSASVSTTLGGVTASLSGSEIFSGPVNTTLDGATAALSGTVSGAGTSGSIAVTLDGASASLTGTVLNPTTGLIATTLDGAAAAVSGVELFSGAISTALDGASAALTGDVFDGSATGSINVTLDGAGASITGTVPDTAIQMVHGWSPKRREKGSYWDKLLSAPVARYVEELPEEVAQVIEAEATQKIERPKLSKAQAERDMRAALDSLGYAYKQAYQEIYLQVVAEMRQAQEDEQIAHLVAMLL